MIIDLKKRAALFSSNCSVENIVYFLLREGSWLLVWIPFLLEFNMQCLKSKHSNKTKFEALFFYGRSVKNIVHSYFLRDLDIGGYALSSLNSTRTAIWMERICGELSFICSRSVWKYRAYLLRDSLDIGRHYFPS